MRRSSGLVLRRMRRTAATLPVAVALLLAFASQASASEARTVASLRHAIRWNHEVASRNQARLSIAFGRDVGGGRLVVCHTTSSCSLVLLREQRSRRWAVSSWAHVMHDESPAGFKRMIVYQYHPCGADATRRALLTTWYENHWVINDQPSPTDDYGGWQINYPAHHSAFGDGSDRAFFATVLDGWRATQTSVRWSHCGADFHSLWYGARNHGIQ